MLLGIALVFAMYNAPQYPGICSGCGDAIVTPEAFDAMLERAASGDGEAARRLGLHIGYEIANGHRPDEDRRLVVYWLAIAAERGDVRALFYTGRMLANDRPEGFRDYGCRQLQKADRDHGLEAAHYAYKSQCLEPPD